MNNLSQKQCPNCYSYVDMQDGSGYCTACSVVICKVTKGYVKYSTTYGVRK